MPQLCSKGLHELTPDNIYVCADGRVGCKPCNRAYLRARYAKKVGRPVGPLNADKTHCRRGHPFDEANTYVHPKTGQRRCKICFNWRYRQFKRRNRKPLDPKKPRYEYFLRRRYRVEIEALCEAVEADPGILAEIIEDANRVANGQYVPQPRGIRQKGDK